jgi:hypothetical protein
MVPGPDVGCAESDAFWIALGGRRLGTCISVALSGILVGSIWAELLGIGIGMGIWNGVGLHCRCLLFHVYLACAFVGFYILLDSIF